MQRGLLQGAVPSTTLFSILTEDVSVNLNQVHNVKTALFADDLRGPHQKQKQKQKNHTHQ
jgi:hypothetical protein